MRKTIVKRIKQVLGQLGYRVSQTPKVLVSKPEAELTLHLDFLVAYYLSTLSNDDFFFIQIGAFDGVTNDPINKFIRKYRWRGILVEPQADVFRVLVENYKDYPQLNFENAAIAHNSGLGEMFRLANPTEDVTNWRSQQSTFRRDRLFRFRQSWPNLDRFIVAEPVRCLTFDDLLDKYQVDRLDLLQIDAEGFDYEILRMVDFDRVRPIIIHYEHRNLSTAEQQSCWRYLVQQGYRIAKESAVDTIVYCGPLPD